MTKTGEIVGVEHFITSRDVKVLKHEPYSHETSRIRMSVEVTRVEPSAEPPVDLRAVTTGRIERTKTAAGFGFDISTKRSFFDRLKAPSQSRRCAAAHRWRVQEEISPSPAHSAFVWDRYEVKFGNSQSMSFLGIMLRDRRWDMNVERLVESYWDLGENPIGGFQSFIDHVIANSQNYDICEQTHLTCPKIGRDSNPDTLPVDIADATSCYQ